MIARLAVVVALLACAACTGGSRIEAPQKSSKRVAGVSHVEVSGPHRLASVRHYVAQLVKQIGARCWSGKRKLELYAVIGADGYVVEGHVATPGVAAAAGPDGPWQLRRCARRILESQRFPRSRGPSYLYAEAGER